MTPPIVPTEDGTPRGTGPAGLGQDAFDQDAFDQDRVDPAERQAHLRRARRWWIIGIVGALLIGATAAAFLVEVPYYVVQPGSVRQVDQRVEVSGAEVFADDGELYFTTVYLNRATTALLVRAWLDDAVQIRSESEMYPDGDRDGARRVNRQRMDISKLTATRVALEQLGIEAVYDADGARVLGISEDSAAADSLMVSDVIVAVDGGEVGLPSEIADRLAARQPGDTVEVTVQRGEGEDSEELTLGVVLGAAPDDAQRPVLGVQVEPVDPLIRSDVLVEVDSGEVSGPSAGVAWTLAIIDQLTPDSLTDGRRVAVTGEIFEDGTIGVVGGLPQKTAAVKRAGISLFVYPADTPEQDQAHMRELAGDELELRPVATIEEALDVLAPAGVDLPA